MIKTLDRYLLRMFFTNYLLSLFTLISLYVVLDLFVNFDEFTEKDKHVSFIIRDIVDYYVYNLPLYFAQLSGVITLFAACATLARLQRNNEVVAILASGTSLFRVALPIVIAGVIMNGLLLLDHELVLPRVAPKLARTRDDVEGARTFSIWCVRDGANRLLSATKFSPRERMCGNLVILEMTPDRDRKQLQGVVMADRARWDDARRGWELEGRAYRVEMGTGNMYADGTLNREPVKFYKTDLTPEELVLRQEAQWVRFLSLNQLAQLQQRGDVNIAQIAQVKHGRVTAPFNNMILLLLGISFFLTRVPKGVLTKTAQALVTCSLSFIIAFIGQQLVGSADVHPAIPAWLPIFIFGPLAVGLMANVKT